MDSEGKISFVWILGQFGHLIDESPYILEKLEKESREMQNSELSSALFISTTKLFFRRAPETRNLFQRLFQEIM